MENLPVYISILFLLTTALTLFLFYKAVNKSVLVLFIVLLWLLLQMVLALMGFYVLTEPAPPKFAALVFPPVLSIFILFATHRGRRLLDRLNPFWLTAVHTLRIPVECCLYFLFLYRKVPKIMTFEGLNFDILAGFSALFILYYGFYKQRLKPSYLLAWNIVCLALLLSIVVLAILSLPTPFQHFGFHQPNIAVLYFPFVWLPGFIVPVVLLAHLYAIRHYVLAGKRTRFRT